MKRPPFRYANRVAIVTGGAGDIGSAVVRHAHANGMRVVIADVDLRRGEALAKELGEERCVALGGDLTQESVLVQLLEQTERHFGGCDVLINNLGMTNTTPFEERSTACIERELAVVMQSPILLTRLAFPMLQRADDPRIITITSLGGITPLKETPIYSAAKFGLRGAMLALALDEARHGISISCVLPTATDTYMLRQEALDGGSVLNFIDEPQPVSAVLKSVIRQLEHPRLESYPKTSDSFIARFGMLFPNLQRRLVPLFEKLGKRGMEKYLRGLEERGLVECHEGTLRQKARQHWHHSHPNQVP